MITVNSEAGFGIEDWIIHLKIDNITGSSHLNRYIITVDGLLTFSPQDPGQLKNLRQEYADKMIWPVRIQQINLAICTSQSPAPLAQSIVNVANSPSPWMGTNTGYQMHFKVDIPIDFSVIDALEKERKDNVRLSFALSLIAEIRALTDYVKRANAGRDFILTSPTFSTVVDFHPDQWIALLKELKYRELWLVYLHKPNLDDEERKDFDKAFSLLVSAGDELFSKSRPDKCVTDLRSAWNALESIRTKYKGKIDDKIKQGSIDSESEKSKSEKVNEALNDTIKLMDSIRNLNHMGPHQEGYTVTYEDALLAYRLSLSEISYLSRIISEITA